MQYVNNSEFESSRRAALAAIDSVDPVQYARSRNFLNGAVTRLSPWITHGFTSVREAAQRISQRHPLGFDDKLIFEFAWREFFKHVHGELGKGILSDVRKPVWSGRYSDSLPADIREGRTGVKAIDESIAMLYSTGYIHNHARMWIASYVVHLRKVNWRVGADWMYAHLLDGDLASNHLSWQWVAGTFSHKPYLFNAANVAKYASQWDCSGTALDTDYEDLESIARSKRSVGMEPGAPEQGCIEPGSAGWNCEKLNANLMRKVVELNTEEGLNAATIVAKRFDEIELIHPWDLQACFQLTQTGQLRVGLIDEAFHRAHHWNDARWGFVMKAMETGCDQIWVLDSSNVSHNANVLARFQTISTRLKARATLNPGYLSLSRMLPVRWTPAETMLPNPERFQQSFSRFYKEATYRAGSLEEALHQQTSMAV